MSGLDWPTGWERTPKAERTRNNSYEVTLSKSFSDLETTLDRMAVDDYRYSFDAQQRKRDGRPYSRANPDDPGFVLRWSMDGDQYAVACDRFSRLRDNVRTVGLYLSEKRKMETRPVATGESEFANARLPPADEDDIVAAPPEPPHEVLGVDPDAPPAVVKGAARALKRQTHPDQGGSAEELQRVLRAENAMLEEADC